MSLFSVTVRQGGVERTPYRVQVRDEIRGFKELQELKQLMVV